MGAVALATLGGLAGVCWLAAVLANWCLVELSAIPGILAVPMENSIHPEIASFPRPWHLLLSAAVLAIAMLPVAPLAAWLGARLPDGGLLFASEAFSWLGGAALMAVLIGTSIRWLMPRQNTVRMGPRFWRGLLLGGLVCVLEMCLFGFTWGTTWIDVSLTPRRVAVGAALAMVLFPVCWLLAVGVQKTLGPSPATLRSGLRRFVAWIGLGLALWIGHLWLVRQDYPFAGIPLLFVLVSGALPLPLWLLSDRPGLCTARAVNHTLATACFLACHLPFVTGG